MIYSSSASQCFGSNEQVVFLWDSDSGLLSAKPAESAASDPATTAFCEWINRQQRVCKDIEAAQHFAVRYNTTF